MTIAKQTNVLYCHCAHRDTLPEGVKREVLAGLCASGRTFTALPDLCLLAARDDPALDGLARSSDLRIAACFPRAVRWLLARCGADPTREISIANMRTDSAGQVLSKLTADWEDAAGGAQVPVGDPPRVVLHESPGGRPPTAERRAGIVATLLDDRCTVTCVAAETTPEAPGDGEMHLEWKDLADLSPEAMTDRIEEFRRESELTAPDDWVPWFPVIDYDRCRNCGQCLNFCLFGTYARSEDGAIEVRNPSHCKTNCPACARICPELAIIFPKHPTGPINGDAVREEDVPGETVKVDPAALARGDVYSALRNRGGPEGGERSTEELIEKLEIPPDVLREK
jgi:Pyruvate/2-oxoacid:ferredoxin oxidoreductase delta subunit